MMQDAWMLLEEPGHGANWGGNSSGESGGVPASPDAHTKRIRLE